MVEASDDDHKQVDARNGQGIPKDVDVDEQQQLEEQHGIEDSLSQALSTLNLNRNNSSSRSPTTPKTTHHRLFPYLPPELHTQILSVSSPLTRHLLLPPPRILSKHLAARLWIEAFDLDWTGDFTLLPKHGLPLCGAGLEKVKSERVYNILCRLFPHLDVWDSVYDIQLETYETVDKAVFIEALVDFKKRLCNIPLRQGWTVVLNTKCVRPLAFFKYACYLAHGKGVSHFVESGIVHLEIFEENGTVFPDLTHESAAPMSVLNWSLCFGCVPVVEYYLQKEELLLRQEKMSLGSESSSSSSSSSLSPNRNGRTQATSRFKIHEDAIDLAASRGDLPMVKLLSQKSPNVHVTSFALRWSSAGGFLDVVKYLCEELKVGAKGGGVEAVDAAAGRGHLEVLKYLHATQNYTPTKTALISACLHSHTPIVTYLLTHSLPLEPCGPICINTVSRTGNLHLLQLLQKHRPWEGATVHAMNSASKHGHLSIVQFLHAHRDEGCTTDAMDYAAARGHLEVVKFLDENRKEGCTKNAMIWAAKNGWVEVVRYLSERRGEGCTTAAMDLAARNGHLDVVKYLHQNRSEGCTKAAFQDARDFGHLDVWEYLNTSGIVPRG
ncbi:hypothetical protein HDV05_002599 [Chytridiales sp. JEL 0842]|nr:hypothetical protein HDV05_002599 [Chytridiales sp. JEL 0842]